MPRHIEENTNFSTYLLSQDNKYQRDIEIIIIKTHVSVLNVEITIVTYSKLNYQSGVLEDP